MIHTYFEVVFKYDDEFQNSFFLRTSLTDNYQSQIIHLNNLKFIIIQKNTYLKLYIKEYNIA
jgi:hypothetical protein